MKKTIITVLAAIAVISYIYITYSPLQRNKTITPYINIEPTSILDDSEPIYTNETYGYSIKLPSIFEVVQTNSSSIQIVTKEKEMGQGPANLIYISVISPEMKESVGQIYNYYSDDYNKLMTISKEGTTTSVADADQSDLDQWNMYTLVKTTQIDGIPTKVFENYKPWEFPNGTTETRYMFEKNGTRYVLGYYTGGDSVGKAAIDSRIAYEIVQSFDLK